jgi:putative transposase
MLNLVHDATVAVPESIEGLPLDLDELCRLAAQEMLAVALEAERRAYLDAHAGVLDGVGHRMVVGTWGAEPARPAAPE